MQNKKVKKKAKKKAVKTKSKTNRDQILDFQSEGNYPRKSRGARVNKASFLERSAKKLIVRIDDALKSIKKMSMRP
jgi:hypothetical protein